MQARAVHFHDVANCCADPVWPVLAALREDANLWPVQTPARMPCAKVDIALVYFMEQVDDFDMGEAVQTKQGFRAKPRCVQLDGCGERIPLVINRLSPVTADMADGGEG